MSAGRPRKYNGSFKEFHLRIPSEKFEIFDQIRLLAELSCMSMNELILELIETSLPLMYDMKKHLSQTSLDLRKKAKIFLFKSRLNERYRLYSEYRKELLEAINSMYPKQIRNNGNIIRDYRILCELRDEIVKLISSAPIVDDEVQELYNRIINDEIFKVMENVWKE